jgi:hypothetical protein
MDAHRESSVEPDDAENVGRRALPKVGFLRGEFPKPGGPRMYYTFLQKIVSLKL